MPGKKGVYDMCSTAFLKGLPIIGLDGGNKLVKCPSVCFHAGLEHFMEKPGVWLGDETDLLRYNGQYFAVSDRRLLYERDKTVNDDYLYLTLIGIAKELQARRMEPAQEIILAVGLPPGHLANEKLTRAMRDYYLRNGGEYRFQCGETRYHIMIREVVVCPQAYSITVTLPREIVRQPNIHLLDIGGGTVDDVMLVNQRPAPDMFSLDMGVIYLYNAIRTKLSNNYGVDVTEGQIDDIILKPEVSPLYRKYPEYINFVHQQADTHVKNIFRAANESGAKWKASFVVFCGGGSLLLREYIARYADINTGGYMIIDDIHANAKGFELFASITLSSRK
jgi:plasmid segregation protein ParM